MSENPLYSKLREHIGHDIAVVEYAEGINVAVECLDCNVVLVDADEDVSDDTEIVEVWREVQQHPDFAGGTIFVRGGDTRELTDDEAYDLKKVLADRLAEIGNELIHADGYGPRDSKPFDPNAPSPELAEALADLYGDENPRQRGDDDGVEYGDPRDHREGRE